MALLINLGQLLLFITIFFQYSVSLPLLQSNREGMEETSRNLLNQLNSLSHDYEDALLEAKQSMSRETELHTRQLGDIEFSNRYAEYLRSKAKLNTICSFLHRMKSIKKSAPEADTERVNELLRMYTCPNMNQWPSDL